MPLLKWPGGKRALAGQIVSCFPDEFGTYFEPFLGGAAVFLALSPPAAILSDINEDLITCYQAVRDQPEEVARMLARWENSPERYYQVRSSRPASTTERAARMIYLTSLAFNGIYRTNLLGEFNVPYGCKTWVQPLDIVRLEAFSNALKCAQLVHGPFEIVLGHARSGDLVYFDPPYTLLNNNGFVKYHRQLFTWQDQIRLAEVSRTLVERGCHVVVSNSSHQSVLGLYPEFETRLVQRQSRIAADSRSRGPVVEAIFVSRGSG